MSDPVGHDDPLSVNPADGQASANSAESEEKSTHTGNAATSVADAGGAEGQLRPAPEIGEAEEAVSRESRRIAEAEGTET